MKLLPAFLRSRFTPLRTAPTRALPSIERLEDRIAPATVTGIGGTLKILGTSASDTISITTSVSNTSPTYMVTHVVNGTQVTDSFSNIKNISVSLLEGSDTLTVTNPVFGNLKGNLSVDGGNGDNALSFDGMFIDGKVSIKNGVGNDTVTFSNFIVGGSVTIANGTGGSLSQLQRTSEGRSFVGGSVSVTAGEGADTFRLTDANVGGNVSFKAGLPGVGNAGEFTINTFYNALPLSIGGNVSVSLQGNTPGNNGIWDADIFGNVAIDFGVGDHVFHFDGFTATVPVHIHGSLTMKTKGSLTLDTGTQYKDTGLIVGKAFSLTTGAGADVLTLAKLQVAGATKLALGDGTSTVKIDDSEFTGAFTLTTGKDIDLVEIEKALGTSVATVFRSNVLIAQGAGSDNVTLFGGTGLGGREIVVWRKFVINSGAGSDSYGEAATKFPFGGHVDFIF